MRLVFNIKRFFLFLFFGLGILTNIIFLHILYKLTIILNRRLRECVYKRIKFVCYHALITFTGLLYRRPFYLLYDKSIKKIGKNISTFNHCSDYDWIFVMVIYYHLEKYADMFVLMKAELGKIPLLGYVIAQNGHIFINRNKGEQSVCDIKEKINFYRKKNKNYTFFLFPEGTYPWTGAVKRMKTFAEKTQLKVDEEPFQPNNVLIPRTKGFSTISTNSDATHILDGTILNNPYHTMLVHEQTHLQYFMKEKVPISPIIIINKQENVNIEPDYLYKAFYEKEKLIEKYKSELKDKNKILEYDEIKKILRAILPRSDAVEGKETSEKHSDLITLRVKSKYRHLFYLSTLLMDFGAFYGTYRGFRCLFRVLCQQ